ncbi:hypothetical protein B0H10DRAFT_1960389 [Mycena sp. CBHHK59/15]|nr:hypothetical protein B0H10DRAFT_1960389 [Mycena sp. CBHHK59/15]
MKCSTRVDADGGWTREDLNAAVTERLRGSRCEAPSGLHLGDKSELGNPTRWDRQRKAKNLANNLHLSERERNARYQRDQLQAAQLQRELLQNQARDTRASRRTESATLPSLSIPSTPALSTPIYDEAMAPALDLFRGDSRGEKPHYWLKKLQGTMSYDTKDEARLYRFEMGLAPGTTAEKWWEQLDRKEKATWADLMTAFKKKWPVPKEAVETPEELRGRIKSTILRSEDLGKLVGPPGPAGRGHAAVGGDHQRPDHASQERRPSDAAPGGTRDAASRGPDDLGEVL